MRTMTLVYAYARATKKVYLAQTYDELETAVRQANLFHNAVESRLSMLERPATQCCPQCEAKQKYIEELEARITKAVEQAIHNAERITDMQDTISVIAHDEPYFANVYGVIRDNEALKGRWTAEDELAYQLALGNIENFDGVWWLINGAGEKIRRLNDAEIAIVVWDAKEANHE